MQNPREIVTEQYPLERPMVAERYRGAPRLNNNPETGETLCIGCNLCALACPENLIVVGWLRDDATRRKVLTHFTYDTSRCMFCGLCEEACPEEAIVMSREVEIATYDRAATHYHKADLLVPESLLKRRLEFLRAEYDRQHAPAKAD